MSPEIRVSVSPGERRVALVSGGVLLDYAIDRPGAPDGVGDLHCGRIAAQMPALAGAFVALAVGEGFLPDSEGARGLAEGAAIRVRVTRAAQGGKGPRLTVQTGDPAAAEGPVRLIARGPGAARRLAADHPGADILIDEAAAAAALRAQAGIRARLVSRAFEDWLEDAVAELAEPSVDLPGGARLHVQPTRALTAIDIDAGAAAGARTAKSTAQAALNCAILPAVAAQIRLRNLSGAIVVDLAGMKTRRRVALAAAFAACLADDPLQPRFLGFTALGLAEILRPRIHPPLHELLAGPHAAALAALREAASRIAADPAAPLALVAAPPILSALQSDAIALAELAVRAGRPLMLQSDASLAPHAWRLERVR